MTSCLRGLLLGSVFILAAAPAFAQMPAPPAPPAPPPAVLEEMDALSFVTWASASVRDAPNGTAELKETLPFGSQVIVTGRLAVGGWVRVQTPNTPVGYMWAQTLAPMRIAMPGAAAEGTPARGPGRRFRRRHRRHRDAARHRRRLAAGRRGPGLEQRPDRRLRHHHRRLDQPRRST